MTVASHEDTTCFEFFFKAIAQDGDFSPDFVLADAAQSITNAAEKGFPDAKRLMCWAHCIKNVDKKLKSATAVERDQIRTEIESLQYATSEEQFENGKYID